MGVDAERRVDAWKAMAEQWEKSFQDRLMVLQSDRDRLTATVEILARRLASPSADHDPARAGWRAANASIASGHGVKEPVRG